MGILDSLKKNLGFSAEQGTELKSPITGVIVPIEEVPDPVFADKVVGDGIAIDPTGNVMVAPCDGVISKIFETNHAFSMITPNGVELFVHFGIDTVLLKGEGFKRIAQEEQTVRAGDPIIEVDLPFFREKAKSVITPVVISNMDDVSHIHKESGNVEAGKDLLMTVSIK
ncbi:PTS glucose transporter subunit IIA [uncultured Endozoicomonas sp.]|uniref:PTS glucose transporter subunit IIA n=1 Tax=uncultured Endozoicomonas sp. TaxID=432652 RepID=UPI002622615A|nr:PTS glucose transporter subunit IIA [uncultured Endozoicomonas sp.]